MQYALHHLSDLKDVVPQTKHLIRGTLMYFNIAQQRLIVDGSVCRVTTYFDIAQL